MLKASAIWLASSADVLVTHAAQLNPLHAEILAVKSKTHGALPGETSRMLCEIRFTSHVSQESSICRVEDT